MKLRSIEFILENCDSIVVDGKYIGEFIVDDIKTSISRIACNAINRMDVTNTVAIELHKDSNKERHAFGCNSFESETVFDRLEGNDITSIRFDLVDEFTSAESGEPKVEHYDYYIDWVGEGDDDSVNSAQSTYISECGNLYLVICKDKTIDDFFNKEEINDEDCVNFSFDMCGVGDKYGDPDRYKDCE